MNKKHTLSQRARDFTRSAAGKAAVVATALVPFGAMASGGGDDFDPAVVTAKITTYVGYGIVMIAAWILGKWTLKSLGVIGGK